MGELEAAKIGDVVGEGFHAFVCEGAAAAKVEMAEFAGRNDGALG